MPFDLFIIPAILSEYQNFSEDQVMYCISVKVDQLLLVDLLGKREGCSVGVEM